MVVGASVLGLAAACSPFVIVGANLLRTEDGAVDDATDVVVTVSTAQPVVTGDLIVAIPETGMQADAPPLWAALGLQLRSSDEDGPARPLARLVVDTRVDGTSLVPVDAEGSSFQPVEDDPAAAALAPWFDAQGWTYQAAVSGFDQETRSTMALGLTCVTGVPCEHRVPFRVDLLETADDPVEVAWTADVEVGYRDDEGEIRPDPPPDGAAVTIEVGNLRSAAGVPGVEPSVQVVDPGSAGVVPFVIDYPVDARGAVARFTVGPTDAWRRSDPWIDGWPERNIYSSAGRDIYEIPLVEGACDAGRCRMTGTMGDHRTRSAGRFRVAVDVRATAEIDAPAIDGVEITIG